MPFCDTVCTSPAAVELSIATITKYTLMGLELSTNNTKIVELNTTIAENFAELSTVEQLSSQAFIRALDGVEKNISAQFEKMGIENTAKAEHFANTLLVYKKELRVADVALQNSMDTQISNVDFSNDAFLMSTELLLSNQEKERLRQKAHQHQLLSPSHIGSNNIATQRSAMMNSTDLTMDNPFIENEIDKELWSEYQRYIALVFNFTPQNSIIDVVGKREQLKRLFALNTLSTFMSENVFIPNSESLKLSKYLGSNSISVKKTLFNSYQKLLLDSNTQLQTKLSNEKTLLIIHNIQLAQRNMMLNELRKVKLMKNEMSSLLVI